MAELFSVEKAQEILNSGLAKAEELLKDTSKVDAVLISLEEKLKTLPTVGNSLASVPLMISMVKSYITKEYTLVSPKVIASLVSAFLYLITDKDLIPDKIPVVGHIDDIAVIALALKFVEPELKAFSEWRETKPAARTSEPEVHAEPAEPIESVEKE